MDFDFFDFNMGGDDSPAYFDYASDFGGGGWDDFSQDTFTFQLPEFSLTGMGWDPESWGMGADQGNLIMGGSGSDTLGGSIGEDTLGGGGWNFGESSIADALMGGGGSRVTGFDPSTGVFTDATGNTVQAQSGGPTSGPATPGGQVTQAMQPDILSSRGMYSTNYDSQGNVVNPSAPYGSAQGQVGSSGPGQAGPGGPAGPQALQGGGGGGGWFDSINKFLGTGVGGVLGALGIGAAGLGAGRLLAGKAPNTPTPSLAPGSPTIAAGQNAVSQLLLERMAREQGYDAQQAPGYQNIRNQAMTLIPGQLQPVTPDNYQDPIRAQMEQELMATMMGGANPMVEAQIKRDWDTLQNTMYRQLGNNPDWQTSSPGMEAVNRFNESADARRFQSRMGTIAGLSQPEQQRRQFEYQAPVEKARALGGEQRAYYDTLANASNLGRTDPFQAAGYFGNPDQYRLPMTNLNFQAGMAGYNQANRDREGIMAGVGGIAGTAAGALGNAGATDRLAKAIRDLGAGGQQPGGVLGQRPWGT